MASRYQPGQVWSYHTRNGEEDSQLVILHLDSTPGLGAIVHVHINGVSIRTPHAPSGIATEITHLPFAEEAINRSVTQQIGVQQPPDFQDAYSTWRSAFDSGQAGVFSITAAQAVDYIEQTLDQGGGVARS